jgi:ABC-type arginine transport system permease subunit
MTEYSSKTIPPPPGDLRDHTDPVVLYRVSNLWTRAIIGILGILLPLIFIFGEAFFLRGGVHVRGSLSAYYHTPMRDIFVAGLCVIGFFLATYLSGEAKTADF